MTAQPEFDFEEVAYAGRATESVAASTDWQEVPEARYLSWTTAEQLRYCAERDYDAAAHADDEWWCQFYFDRAAGYMRLFEVARG